MTAELYTLGIDPATHGCGCSMFKGARLVAAGYARNDAAKDVGIMRRCATAAKAVHGWWVEHIVKVSNDPYILPPDQFVAELPQFYTAGKGNKGDQNEIVVPLAMINGAIAALFQTAATFAYKPHDWKGNTKKPASVGEEVKQGKVYVIKQRVKSRFEGDEASKVDWTKSVEHSWDVADAIAVGMHHLGRFDRIRTFARE